jgi:hypothetical protein
VIEYIGRSGPPEAMNCPALICDACRQQITSKGNVVWGTTVGAPGPLRGTPVYTTHKGRCDRLFDLWFAKTYQADDGWMQRWEEAHDFMRQLAHNLTNAFADDTDGEYHHHTLVLPDAVSGAALARLHELLRTTQGQP